MKKSSLTCSWGDVTRLVMTLHSRAEAGSHDADTALTAILTRLEEGLARSDLKLRDLILASFLENLERTAPLFSGLRTRLGKRLLRALDNQDRTPS